MKAPLIISGTVLLVLAGVGLFGYSPASCSCAEPWMEFAGEAGLFGKVEGYKDLTAPGLEAGLNRTLTGTKLDSRSYPVSETQYCSTQDNLTFKCRVPMEQSRFMVHGFDVTYEYTSDGAFVSASVSRLTWRRP